MAIDKKIPVSKITVDGEELPITGGGEFDLPEFENVPLNLICGRWEGQTGNREGSILELNYDYTYTLTFFVDEFGTGDYQPVEWPGTYSIDGLNIVLYIEFQGSKQVLETYSFNKETGKLTDPDNENTLLSIVSYATPTGGAVEPTLEAIVGYWKTPEEGSYFKFKDDYTGEVIGEGQVQVTFTYSISGNTVTLTMGEEIVPLVYNGGDCSLSLGEVKLYKLNPSGTLDITENGTHFVAPYAEVNVNVAGGGNVDSGGEYLVQVIDYDGTILKQDHLDTGATFTLPKATTNHERLLFQEWSSPVDITDNTITVGNSDITIGAVYTTKSGLSEFDITLTKVTGLDVTLKMDGTKNWGDGTSDDLTTHTYSNYGDYMITCNGTTMTASVSSGLFGQGTNAKIYNCKNIRFANVTSIVNYALRACCSLTNITIPNSVTSIGHSAFNTCHSLNNINIPNGVTSIGNYVFSSCYSLNNITIPNGVTSIGNNAFSACYSLNNINIPNGVTSIGSSVFQNCASLESIIIPSGITSINDGTFQYCHSIFKYDMTSLNAVPTLSNTNAFASMKQITKIYVPDALYDEWIIATNWSTYADYIYKASEMPKGE